MKLEELKSCFQGIVPSVIATCSREGIPNVAYLSEVHLVDSQHVALTSQYFNKTLKNLKENPLCSVRVTDPVTFRVYRLVCRHERTETAGSLFDEMSLRLAAIADYSGASHLLKLNAVEILSVSEIMELPGESTAASDVVELQKPQFTVTALQNTTERINSAASLEEALDSVLRAMDLEFGFRNSMVLLYERGFDRLLTIATRGYSESGVGSEVRLGEGVIGRAAESKKPLMYTSLLRDLIYARSARRESDQNSEGIALPGLPAAQSQIAVPLLLRGELLGVLFAESAQIFDFRESDDQLLRTLGSFLALAIQSLSSDDAEVFVPAPPPRLRQGAVEDERSSTIDLQYHADDDSLFVNGEYLIRNVPARILLKLVREYLKSGKRDFTNRELRMDASLELPEIKDNLESRLILLRRRLELKCPALRLVSSGRGRFRFEVDGVVKLGSK